MPIILRKRRIVILTPTMDNPELDLAWHIVANTDTHIFLTGKAGTGKTTFLRQLKEKLPKRMVVLAPTGIAAINAQGVTIHSFFQLPFGPQIPDQGLSTTNKRYAFRKQKIRLIRSLDLIVIDEISMVRADLLDSIDSVLRQYRDRSLPFGGVQMLLIGDMQQLAPVAKDEEWSLLSKYYQTPYFFSSKALQNTDFVTVELKKVYRQSDKIFLDLLNKIRTNNADDATLAELNKRYIQGFDPPKEEGYVRLTTHNYQADAINTRELEALQSMPYTFEAEVKDDFPEFSYPTDAKLTLKQGAQVMFIKNDSSTAKLYFNGMIGEIVHIDKESIKVRPANGDPDIKVAPETWQNVKYTLNERTKEIEEKVVGTFTQYPLKTAWAITIHKSQGLTFDKAIIDVQHSFAHGQTYVALSRCKTLDGMVLSSLIPQSAIINDATVEDFASDPRHQSPDEKRLDQMERLYMIRTLENLFSFTQIRYGYNDMIRLLREHFYDKYNKQYNKWVIMSDIFKKEVEQVATTFHRQYRNLVITEEDYANSEVLQERVKKGAGYFEEKVNEVYRLLVVTNIDTNNQAISERLENIGNTMVEAVRIKAKLLHYVARNGIHLNKYLNEKAKIALTFDKK